MKAVAAERLAADPEVEHHLPPPAADWTNTASSGGHQQQEGEEVTRRQEPGLHSSQSINIRKARIVVGTRSPRKQPSSSQQLRLLPNNGGDDRGRPAAVGTKPKVAPQRTRERLGARKGCGTLAPFNGSAWAATCGFLTHEDAVSLALANHRVRGFVCAERGWVVDSDTGDDDDAAGGTHGALVLRRTHSVNFAAQVLRATRADLTSLWLLASTPPSYQACVRGLRLPDSDFDLEWLQKRQERPLLSRSLLDIPVGPTIDVDGHFRISSPRSVIVLLRNGVALSEILPKSLHVMMKEGSLEGTPVHLCEKRFATREKRRLEILEKVRGDYANICSSITQADFVQMLFSVCPEEHPDFPIRNDAMPIDESSLNNTQLTRKLSIIANTASKREQSAQERQNNNRLRFERYLRRNREIAMNRVKDAKVREAAEAEKFSSIQRRRIEDLRQREEKLQHRNNRLQQVIDDGKAMEELRRREMERRIADHEERWAEQQRMRDFARQLEEEERHIAKRQKQENMMRHERMVEFQKLRTVDRIRRKLDRCVASVQTDMETRKAIKFERDKCTMEMKELVRKHDDEILAFQRKSTTEH